MMHLEEERYVCRAQYAAGGLEITATLLARFVGADREYIIVLEQTGERVCCALGSDTEVAKRLFFDVVFGGVTACTLADVVEDRLGMPA